MFKKISHNTKKVIFTTLVSIIVAISSYTVMYLTNFKQYEEEISNKLYMLGKEQKDSLNRFLNEIEEEVVFVSNINGIKTLNQNEIVRISSYLMSTKSRYKKLIVMNTKGNVLYGYLEKPEEIYENSSFEKAIVTKEVSKEVKSRGNDYVVNIYCPIINSSGESVGIIYLEIQMDEIRGILKTSKTEEGMESYVVNKEGVMLTESRFVPDAVGKVKVNLKSLKISIDHLATAKYKDYRGEEVYGRYFNVDNLGWTLIVESDYTYSKMKQEKTKAIGQITVALQGLCVFLVQIYLRKRFDLSLDEIIEDDNIKDALKIDLGGEENGEKNKDKDTSSS